MASRSVTPCGNNHACDGNSISSSPFFLPLSINRLCFILIFLSSFGEGGEPLHPVNPQRSAHVVFKFVLMFVYIPTQRARPTPIIMVWLWGSGMKLSSLMKILCYAGDLKDDIWSSNAEGFCPVDVAANQRAARRVFSCRDVPRAWKMSRH